MKSTKDLSSTLSQKALQLHDSSQALQTAKKAVDEAQTYWSNHQPPPAAPPAPDYFDYGSSSDYATAVGQYNTDKKSYDGTVDSREAAMETQYNLLQKQLDNAGTALRQGELDRGVGHRRRAAVRAHRWFGGRPTGGSTGGGLPPPPAGPSRTSTRPQVVRTTRAGRPDPRLPPASAATAASATATSATAPPPPPPPPPLPPTGTDPQPWTPTPSVDGTLVGSSGGTAMPMTGSFDVGGGSSPAWAERAEPRSEVRPASSAAAWAWPPARWGWPQAACRARAPWPWARPASAVCSAAPLAAPPPVVPSVVRGGAGGATNLLAGQNGVAGRSGVGGASGRGGSGRGVAGRGGPSGTVVGGQGAAGGRATGAKGAGGRGGRQGGSCGWSFGTGGAGASGKTGGAKVAGRGGASGGRGAVLAGGAGTGRDRDRKRADDLSLVTEDQWVDKGETTDGVVRRGG